MSSILANSARGQFNACSSAAYQQALPQCHPKHQWLLGMLGPCPLRRPCNRTARNAALLASTSAATDVVGDKVTTAPGVAAVQPQLVGEGRELRMDSDDDGPDAVAGLGQDLQRSTNDRQPLQLASKPQPRARARPQLLQISAAESSADADPYDQRMEGPSASSADTPERTAADASDPANVSLEPRRPVAPMGLKTKTLIVRRIIEEQGLSSLLQQKPHEQAQQPSASSTSQVGNLTRITEERLSQRRLAHLNKVSRRVSRANRTAAADADGDVTDSDDASTSSAFSSALASEAVTYGHPQLRSVHSSSGIGRTPAPSAPSRSYGSEPGYMAATSTARHVELPMPGNLPRPTRAEMERLVRECSDLGALRMLYSMYGARLAREELVLLVNQLAEVHDPAYMTVKLWAATQAMLVELLQRITPLLKELTMQEYVVMLAGVAKLRYVPPNDWIAAVLTQSKPRLYNASPSNLAHALKAIARITVDPSDVKSAATWEGWMRRFLTAVQRQLPAFRADELVKTLVALSELRYRPAPEWMHKFSGALHARLDALEAHSLSEAMLAFAALRYQPEGPFLRAYYSQLYARLPLADDQDLATYAQAAALLDRVIRQDFMQEFLAEVLEKLATFKPQYLANLLNAMGRLAAPSAPDRVRVPPGWTGAVAAHVGANLSTFSGSALASAAWGLSMLGLKGKPQFLDDLLSASYGKLHTCGPTDLILLITALGNLGFTPLPGREALWGTWMAEFERFASRKSYDTRGVCDLMAAVARVPRPITCGSDGRPNAAAGPRSLHPDFVAGVLRSTRIYQLRNTSPARLAALAGALATLGVRPDFGFLYNYAQAARVMWTSFTPRDYATLLGALVHIGTPGLADSRWAPDFLAITLCRMSEFDGPSLAASLDALRRLPKPEFTPSTQWLAAAAQRAVDLIRSPPPPLLEAAIAAAELAPVPAAATAAVGATVAAVPLMVPQSGGAVAGGSASTSGGGAGGAKPAAASPGGWVLPMRPLTPDLLVVLVEALVVLGYRTEPKAPLVQIIRNLLSTTATRLKLQDRVRGSVASPPRHTAATVGSLVDGDSESTLVHLQPDHSQQGSAGAAAAAAAAAAAFERAKEAAATAVAVSSKEAPRPPLDRQQAAALEAALATLLGRAASSEQAAPSAVAVTSDAAANPVLPDLPRSALRSPQDLAEVDAKFAAKLAAQQEKRQRRASVQVGEGMVGAATVAAVAAAPAVDNASTEAGNSGVARNPSDGARRPGVRMPSYNPQATGSIRPQSAPSADAARRERGSNDGSGHSGRSGLRRSNTRNGAGGAEVRTVRPRSRSARAKPSADESGSAGAAADAAGAVAAESGSAPAFVSTPVT